MGICLPSSQKANYPKKGNQWQKSGEKGKQALQDARKAAGLRPTCRGYRGQRVGEAKDPGPDHLQIWSQNMRSWNTSSMALFTDANDAHIDVLLLQEGNINPISTAAMMNKAHRYGWQAIHVPPTSKARGGVAVLVLPPRAIVELQRFESEQGQFLLVACHGLQEAILLGSLYGHNSDAQFHVPQTLCHIIFWLLEVVPSGSLAWVLTMTWSMALLLANCNTLEAFVMALLATIPALSQYRWYLVLCQYFRSPF